MMCFFSLTVGNGINSSLGIYSPCYQRMRGRRGGRDRVVMGEEL